MLFFKKGKMYSALIFKARYFENRRAMVIFFFIFKFSDNKQDFIKLFNVKLTRIMSFKYHFRLLKFE